MLFNIHNTLVDRLHFEVERHDTDKSYPLHYGWNSRYISLNMKPEDVQLPAHPIPNKTWIWFVNALYLSHKFDPNRLHLWAKAEDHPCRAFSVPNKKIYQKIKITIMVS